MVVGLEVVAQADVALVDALGSGDDQSGIVGAEVDRREGRHRAPAAEHEGNLAGADHIGDGRARRRDGQVPDAVAAEFAATAPCCIVKSPDAIT